MSAAPRGGGARRVLAVLVTVLAPVLGALAPGPAGAGESTPGAAPASAVVTARGACSTAVREFRPTRVVVPGVVGATRVLARERDRRGAPLPPPLTPRGKWQLAWDRPSRTGPGSARGVVRMLAHTYPRSGSHGGALGNRLLRRLHAGDRVVVTGPKGQRLCYDVTRRVRVRAGSSPPGFYSVTSRPRLAILVCSGVRRGPGDWSHRTIWYADPVRD
ncbi:class F sortase [Nocardioides sp. SYSU D00038]|uniref:class F sortase n=1 Tax=Nocardioides sp. SYSU D00038 TaxID=2812554 RepID=UPI0019672282|nr:class F sortase [Nocardioides sp. SYSU D00038]